MEVEFDLELELKLFFYVKVPTRLPAFPSIKVKMQIPFTDDHYKYDK